MDEGEVEKLMGVAECNWAFSADVMKGIRKNLVEENARCEWVRECVVHLGKENEGRWFVCGGGKHENFD
jgi:hypothetical protein